MKKSLFILAVVAALAGCGETKYLTKRHYVPLDLSSAMTKKVEPPAPPDKLEYVGDPKTPLEDRLNKRISLLHTLNIDLYKQLEVANFQLSEIEKFNTYSKNRIKELNDKEVYRDKVD